MASENLELHLLSKATALQQAGMVPVLQDIDQVAEIISDLLNTEGLH